MELMHYTATKRDKWNEYAFYGLFFMPLLGTAALGYVYIIIMIAYYFLSLKNKVSNKGGILGGIFIVVLLMKLVQMGNFTSWTVLSRFYFGWGFTLYYMYLTNTRIQVDKLQMALAIEIIIEGILINTVVSATSLPNYPDTVKLAGFEADYIGYQRPYSIGNNTSMTSSILVILAAYRVVLIRYKCLKESSLLDVLTFLSLLISSSGTGLFLYLMVVLYQYRKRIKLSHIATFVVLVLIVIGLYNYISTSTIFLLDQTIFGHADSKYVDIVMGVKGDEIDMYNKMIGNNKLLGITNIFTFGDIAAVEFYVCCGIMGLFVFTLFVLSFINRYNWLPVIVGVIGIIHYAGIFVLPGELIWAYALLLDKKRIKEFQLKYLSINKI